MEASKRDQCHDSVLNLYSHLRRDEVSPNQRFLIRSIFDTEKCQEFHDLRRIREATAAKLCESVSSRNLEEARGCEEVCADVAAHYRTLYKKEVLRSLWWRTRAWYVLNDNHVIASAMIGGTFGAITNSPIHGALVAGATDAFYKMCKKS